MYQWRWNDLICKQKMSQTLFYSLKGFIILWTISMWCWSDECFTNHIRKFLFSFSREPVQCESSVCFNDLVMSWLISMWSHSYRSNCNFWSSSFCEPKLQSNVSVKVKWFDLCTKNVPNIILMLSGLHNFVNNLYVMLIRWGFHKSH